MTLSNHKSLARSELSIYLESQTNLGEFSQKPFRKKNSPSPINVGAKKLMETWSLGGPVLEKASLRRVGTWGGLELEENNA